MWIIILRTILYFCWKREREQKTNKQKQMNEWTGSQSFSGCWVRVCNVYTPFIFDVSTFYFCLGLFYFFFRQFCSSCREKEKRKANLQYIDTQIIAIEAKHALCKSRDIKCEFYWKHSYKKNTRTTHVLPMQQSICHTVHRRTWSLFCTQNMYIVHKMSVHAQNNCMK